jgi:hypothetical protein
MSQTAEGAIRFSLLLPDFGRNGRLGLNESEALSFLQPEPLKGWRKNRPAPSESKPEPGSPNCSTVNTVFVAIRRMNMINGFGLTPS